MYIFECMLEIEPNTEPDYDVGTLPGAASPNTPIPTSRSMISRNEQIMKALEGADRVKDHKDIESRDLNSNIFGEPIFRFMSMDIEHAQRYANTLFPYFQDIEWNHVTSDSFGNVVWGEFPPLHRTIKIDNIWSLQKDGIMLYLIAIPVDQMTDDMKLSYFDKVCDIAYEAYLRYVLEDMENELTGSRGMLSDPDKELSAC